MNRGKNDEEVEMGGTQVIEEHVVVEHHPAEVIVEHHGDPN